MSASPPAVAVVLHAVSGDNASPAAPSKPPRPPATDSCCSFVAKLASPLPRASRGESSDSAGRRFVLRRRPTVANTADVVGALESASATTLVVPGRYSTSKSNS
ncbi:hypothetical protein PF005_g27767 [Phytophthora fragariae]|uniref:Uncharacterized protein n=1 Tax=Phytophthora fragariae TaxID=53985 RepID=A0A6A3DTQ3_9STRA|nr:hypothetical protein PF009_g26231 [Phytophthora fragariae]KAE8958192.1 hypothetical protein PF011_g30869 [Phytophthora fragariae]KAE9080427.1 hypothetical protein PF006_g27313 [Phytophthora fragariae]KAE9169919.1 hypothetical protein PF005_g27767 [Phytophthora fragariae]KAE9181280.1 hypothetical protein PF002_g27315 [Phytophthora fragariae]